MSDIKKMKIRTSRRPIFLTEMMILAVQPAHKIEGEWRKWWGGRRRWGRRRRRRRRREVRIITLGQNCERLRPAPATGPRYKKAKPSQSSPST
jgi:hypothetical protein